MKLFLVLALLAATVFAADAHKVTVLFNLQTNSPLCFPEVSDSPRASFGCLPKDVRLAGVLALAKTDDASVTAYRFTAVATLADGTTITKSVVADRAKDRDFTSAVLWLGKEPSDFSNAQVTVTALRDTNSSTTAIAPQLEY